MNWYSLRFFFLKTSCWFFIRYKHHMTLLIFHFLYLVHLISKEFSATSRVENSTNDITWIFLIESRRRVIYSKSQISSISFRFNITAGFSFHLLWNWECEGVWWANECKPQTCCKFRSFFFILEWFFVTARFSLVFSQSTSAISMSRGWTVNCEIKFVQTIKKEFGGWMFKALD